ncbi:Methyltransferase domain-containing protein [Faunimonas pinastri]|uniref:Methyltransferase domain-containing protein n=1 Tax=Faunimonas pinastri TaxID=1855383 RepID=A0A1H9NBI1_9HYPH|nr:Methyltransferase domain-containing protein [Faunimonas pinastri]
MSVIEVVKKSALRRNVARALRKRTPGVDFLLRAAVDDLGDRLATVERVFERAVLLAPDTHHLAGMVQASGKAGSILQLAPAAVGLAPDIAAAVADEEALPLAPASIDLFATALSLQWTNDLPGAMVQIRQALRPDGLFLASLFGGSTLVELRDSLMQAETELRGGASPRVLSFADVRQLGALLQRAGFALPVADRDTLTVRYDSAFGLMADLRAMGAANVLTDRDTGYVGRDLFLRTAQIYAERYSDPDGRIRATFEIVSLSGWAPHESQQKPLRPGSAKVSLADVLGHDRPGKSQAFTGSRHDLPERTSPPQQAAGGPAIRPSGTEPRRSE